MRYAIGVCVDGHYQIEDLLGQGGAGETYKANLLAQFAHGGGPH